MRELVASCWETAAVDAARAGQTEAARKALATADRTASAQQKRRIALDRIALLLDGRDLCPAGSTAGGRCGSNDRGKLAELESFGGDPPEAYVDLGIVYDLLGRPRDAYDAWLKAKAKNAGAPSLQKWIDAKKRIYGY